MTQPIFTYVSYKEGVADDSALELLAAAKKIDSSASPAAIVPGSGEGLDALCKEIASSFEEVWKIDKDFVAYPTAEVLRRLLENILPKGAIVLLPHDHFGMDLGPGLSIKLEVPFLPDVVGFDGVADGKLTAVRQEHGGQVSAHVLCDISSGAVITIRPGSFQAPEKTQEAAGRIVDKTSEAVPGSLPALARRFVEIAEAPPGDVDITKSDILVSVGRGIGDQENLEMVHDLAKAMGGEVSCSRPIVDANWLEKARQVGNSGQTVKPKVYLALGISGAFQHLAGIKGNPFLVAINKNTQAPIFQVAEVGIKADIVEFIPQLTEKIKKLK